jgi:hypothetical protein
MVMSMAIRTAPESGFRRRLLTLLLAGMLGIGMQPALAARDIPWDALSKSEQSVLRKHRGNWSSMSPSEQARLRRGAQQYLDLPPEKRKQVERKRSQYKKMSPEERERLRKKYSKQKKSR